ncbi:hypothetical protein [Flavobacterium sp. HSC-61S13]|uniref:hypothetical protein n=1 Tax=Flavobacterium sp. HSC-61S13 TaxID=2910963 RepID=UPI00209FC7DA|nr:hypothetical protein [Flavobacterium sp. HSC-61S13]MCP1997029.1 hypothetical protein [Flavobacterium sp. HSC-61S13]
MKNIRIFAFLAIASLLTVSCSSDDSTPNLPTETQKELEAKFPVVGTYEYAHGAMKIPYVFTAQSLVVQNSNMSGEDTEEVVVKAYQQIKDGVYKIVTRESKTAQYTAFFLRNVTNESLEINMDHSFATEKEAIDSKYADPNEGPNSTHTKFGWLKLNKASIASIALPVSGKFIFDGTSQPGGGIYTYAFTNEKVTFDSGHGAYDMKVLNFNKTTNKILLEGLDTKAGTFYVAQLKDITTKSVQIARVTKAPLEGSNPKAEAEAIFKDTKDLEGNFTKYYKEDAILPVQGVYEFDGTSMGGGIYTYTFSNETISFDSGTPYSMKVLAYNKTLNTILLEGIDASVQGVFYVIKLDAITATSVAVGRDTFKATADKPNPKDDATATFNGKTPFAGRLTPYQKK